MGILDIESEDALVDFIPTRRGDVNKLMARGFINTINRLLFEGNQITFDALRNLSPKSIHENEIYGLVFGPKVATNLFKLPSWQDFLSDYLASDFPIPKRVVANKTHRHFFLAIKIAFLTERGREWLSYHGIKFAHVNDNEIGYCTSDDIDHQDLMVCGIENNVLYGVSRFPRLFIQAYEIEQNDTLIERNMEFIIKCCTGDLPNDCSFQLLRKIVNRLPKVQLVPIFRYGRNTTRQIITPHIDWRRIDCWCSEAKVPDNYLSEMCLASKEIAEKILYSYLSQGWPTIRLSENFVHGQKYIDVIKSSPRIRALVALTDTGTFDVEDYPYLWNSSQEIIRTCLTLKQFPSNMMSALPIELLFLVFFYL